MTFPSQRNVRPLGWHADHHWRTHAVVWLMIGLLAAGTYWVAASSPVDRSAGDARGSLLTAQALIEHHTVQLDSYPAAAHYNSTVERDGHRYYYFPPGTPILSMPAVWLANILGNDLADPLVDSQLQNILSALVAAATAIVVFMLARTTFPPVPSLLFTVAFIFGTSLLSSTADALRSINLTVLFGLLALLIVVYDASHARPANPYLLGICLFGAFFCRPTAIILVALVFGYLLLRRRPLLLRTAASFSVLLGIFVLLSWRTYGQLLPDYYLPTRLEQTRTFWAAVYGNLLSPSRGLLILSPFIGLVLVGVGLTFRQLRQNPLFWLAALWFVLHLLAISRFPHWWGGWGFGTRLLTEALPAWVLLALLVWQSQGIQDHTLLRRVAVAAFVVLAVAGIYINTAQGLYNRYTQAWTGWDGAPNIDAYPDYLFDWQYPQFLASSERNAARNARHTLRVQPPLTLGTPISPDSERAVFENWYATEREGEAAWRWSPGHAARILFQLAKRPQTAQTALVYHGASLPGTLTTVTVNGVPVGVIQDAAHAPGDVHRLVFDSRLLQISQPRQFAYNTIQLETRAAALPGQGDTRTLGVRLDGFSLEPAP